MSNPVLPCVHAKTMAANNDDNKSSQGKMGEFRVRADAPSATPVFDEVLSEAGAKPPLSSRSVHQTESAVAANDAHRLGEELIKLAKKVEAVKYTDTEEGEGHLLEYVSQMSELLLNSKVNVNQADENGWTALHHAANSNNQPAVMMLLLNDRLKADKTIKSNDGKMPIDLAIPGSPAHFYLTVDFAGLAEQLGDQHEGFALLPPTLFQ